MENLASDKCSDLDSDFEGRPIHRVKHRQGVEATSMFKNIGEFVLVGKLEWHFTLI